MQTVNGDPPDSLRPAVGGEEEEEEEEEEVKVQKVEIEGDLNLGPHDDPRRYTRMPKGLEEMIAGQVMDAVQLLLR